MTDFEPHGTWPLKRRTRFFVRYATQHGIRFSALLFLVASHTSKKYRAGKRGRQGGWHASTEWFSEQLGVSGRQVRRLLCRAKELGLLDFIGTGRGVLAWVTKQEVYRELVKNDEDETLFGFYYPRLVTVLGLNGSMIYRLLCLPDEEDEYRKVTPGRVVACLPWLDHESARKELEQLWQRGAVQRERNKLQWAAGKIGFRYYWAKRTLPDRQKWKLCLQIQAENAGRRKCPTSGENVLPVEEMSALVEKMSDRKSLRYALGRSRPLAPLADAASDCLAAVNRR